MLDEQITFFTRRLGLAVSTSKQQEQSPNRTEIGSKLRRARRARRMRIREVAQLAGCTESMLSKIETNKATPSLELLHKIVEVVGTNISNLFANGPADEQIVQRAGSRSVVEVRPGSEGGVSLELLVPQVDAHLLQGNIHIVPPGAGSQGAIRHDGEEIGYVLTGELELTVAGKTYFLNEGDSFYFRSSLDHGYINKGEKEARIAWINSPPTF